MPFQTHELDQIKQATADALVANLPMYPGTLTDGEVVLLTLAAIDAAAADPTDPRPFRPGVKVRVIATDALGTITKVVEAQGEVHTIWVSMTVADVVGVQAPFSPRELEVSE